MSNPSVQSSPAKGDWPRTYDHTRQPGIDDQRPADEERKNDMDDCVGTSIPLPTSTFQEKYLPVPIDFDARYSRQEVEKIRKAFKRKIAARQKAHNAQKWQTIESDETEPPEERPIVQAWVRTTFLGICMHCVVGLTQYSLI